MLVPDKAYEVPIGTVAVRREGQDVTLLANMLMVHRSLEAARSLADEGLSVEVIDLRCLAPLDMDTLVRSVKKTNRVLIVEEDNMTGGWGAEVASRLGQEAFYYLDAPIKRLAGLDTSVPAARVLEAAYMPTAESILGAVHNLMDGV
jgi:pyruvate/2-oxoglutarate/acetoin dehydrogenase E1 component